MEQVTLIGTGHMGSAIGRALLAAGVALTAWNRSSDKLAELVAAGATPAGTAAAAIAASPVVLICVRDYAATLALLQAPQARSLLQGRLLVQLTSGSSADAREMAAFVESAGAAYLDGAILVYPEVIGTPAARIAVAGPRAAFERCEPLLKQIAPGAEHSGERVGSAAAQESALMAFVLGGFLGFMHGLRVCETEGLDPRGYAQQMCEVSARLGGGIAQLADRILEGRFEDTGAPLNTFHTASRLLLEQAVREGLDTGLPDYAHRLLSRAMAAGFGDQDFAALSKVDRHQANGL